MEEDLFFNKEDPEKEKSINLFKSDPNRIVNNRPNFGKYKDINSSDGGENDGFFYNHPIFRKYYIFA